jgi:Gpi18-like mannosyltransferase
VTKPLLDRPWPVVAALVLVMLSVAARIIARNVETSDLDFYVLRWMAKFQQLGVGAALGKDFYNYSPPYMYLLALASMASRFIPPLIAVKLISTAFDVLAAFTVFRIVRLMPRRGNLAYLAAALVFAAPTVVANSGIWGQADSTYTAFLLLCLYFMLVDRPLPAVLFYSIGFAFKPQAVFLAPLLLVLMLWRKIPWFYLLLVPGVYALAAWPAVALGRTWMEVLTIYASRPLSGKALTHNAASFYAFVPRTALELLAAPGVVIGALLILVWVLYTSRHTRRVDRPAIVLLALISAALTPFVLPNMHDRYFFPADVLAIALAFSLPDMWFIAIFFQLISGLSYSIYLLSGPPDNLEGAAWINLFTLILLLRRQVLLQSPAAGSRTTAGSAPP